MQTIVPQAPLSTRPTSVHKLAVNHANSILRSVVFTVIVQVIVAIVDPEYGRKRTQFVVVYAFAQAFDLNNVLVCVEPNVGGSRWFEARSNRFHLLCNLPASLLQQAAFEFRRCRVTEHLVQFHDLYRRAQ